MDKQDTEFGAGGRRARFGQDKVTAAARKAKAKLELVVGPGRTERFSKAI